MVSQRQSRKKIPRKGTRCSLRLIDLNSRPKLDVVFEKSLPKSQTPDLQSVDGRPNLRTKSTFIVLSEADQSSSAPRSSRDDDRSKRLDMPPKTKLRRSSMPWKISPMSIVDGVRKLKIQSQLYSEADSFSKSSHPFIETPKSGASSEDQKCCINQLEAPPPPPSAESSEVKLLEKFSTRADYSKLPTAPSFEEAGSFPELEVLADDGGTLKSSKPIKNYLHNSAVDANVKPRRQPPKRLLRNSKLTSLPTKTNNNDTEKNAQRMRKEFNNAAKSFEVRRETNKKNIAPGSRKIRNPRKLGKINNPEGDEGNIINESTSVACADEQCSASVTENSFSIDELCTQFQMCEFTSKPKFFVGDDKVSLEDCLVNLGSKNFLSQKLDEINYVKPTGRIKQLPNLIPINFTPGFSATMKDDTTTCSSLPDSIGTDDSLEIHNILKSITHIYSKIPSYEPFDENWFEGFDCWSK